MRSVVRTFCGMAAVGLLAGAAAAADLAYDEKADASTQVQAALAAAQRENKQVLLVFGANWCPDCRALDGEMRQGRLERLLAERYRVVKVDVGRFDKNLDLAQRFDNPVKKGIPSIAVVDAAGRAVAVTRAGELASARSMGEAAIYRFFQDLARPPRAPG
jgi:thioredoxin 1